MMTARCAADAAATPNTDILLAEVHQAIKNDDIIELDRLINTISTRSNARANLLNSAKLRDAYFGNALATALRYWHTEKCQCCTDNSLCYCKSDDQECQQNHRDEWNYQNRLKIVKLLLDNGCDPTITDCHRQNAIHYANKSHIEQEIRDLILAYPTANRPEQKQPKNFMRHQRYLQQNQFPKQPRHSFRQPRHHEDDPILRRTDDDPSYFNILKLLNVFNHD